MARRGRDSAPVRKRRDAEQQARRRSRQQFHEQFRRASQLQRERDSQAAQERREQERAAVYAVDTGMGRCPNCGSTNLIAIRKSEEVPGGRCLACCLFGLLAPLFFALFRSRYTAVRCRACGHEWPAA